MRTSRDWNVAPFNFLRSMFSVHYELPGTCMSSFSVFTHHIQGNTCVHLVAASPAGRLPTARRHTTPAREYSTVSLSSDWFSSPSSQIPIEINRSAVLKQWSEIQLILKRTKIQSASVFSKYRYMCIQFEIACNIKQTCPRHFNNKSGFTLDDES